MPEERDFLVGSLGVMGLFIAIQLGALALAEPFIAADVQAVEDPADPTNSLFFIGAILVMTVLMLAAFRYSRDRIIRGLIILVSASLVWMVLSVLIEAVFGGLSGLTELLIVGGLPVVGAVLTAIGLLYYPEWYVIDTVGILVGAGAAGLFGTSFGPFPAIIFLFLLAIYDAISVYGTKHMLTLADGVMDMRVPVVLVVPTTEEYTFLEDSKTEPTEGVDTPQRQAIYIGLGDAVMPTILVVSAVAFHPELATVGVPFLSVNAPAAGAIVGTLAGLGILMWLVAKGRPHAGLPLLNGGAIGGYLIGGLVGGLTLVEAAGWPF